MNHAADEKHEGDAAHTKFHRSILYMADFHQDQQIEWAASRACAEIKFSFSNLEREIWLIHALLASYVLSYLGPRLGSATLPQLS